MAWNLLSCCVYTCNNSTLNTNDPNIQFYAFPKQPKLLQQWLNACLWREDQLDIDLGNLISQFFYFLTF